jgi:hypothetical protein
MRAKFFANLRRAFSIGLLTMMFAFTPINRICAQGETAGRSESKARELWAKVRKATDAMEAGTLDFYYRLGHQSDWPEIHVHAAWYEYHLVLSLLAPTRSRADFEIAGRTVLDWGAGISKTIVVPTLESSASHAVFAQPFKLGSILAILFDPTSRAFDLAGSPIKAVDGGDEWVFSFPVPQGYSGPGYACSVSKTTMLPKALSRKGEGMPDLSIRYRLSSISKDFAKLPTFGKGRRGIAPGLGVAYERSQFCHEYGHVFRTPPKGP